MRHAVRDIIVHVVLRLYVSDKLEYVSRAVPVARQKQSQYARFERYDKSSDIAPITYKIKANQSFCNSHVISDCTRRSDFDRIRW